MFDTEMLQAACADLLANPTDTARRVGPEHSMHIVNDEDWDVLNAPSTVHVETLIECVQAGLIEDADEVMALHELYLVLDGLFGERTKRITELLARQAEGEVARG